MASSPRPSPAHQVGRAAPRRSPRPCRWWPHRRCARPSRPRSRRGRSRSCCIASSAARPPGCTSSRIRCSRRAQVRRRAVILVAADKGLCGALNTNVFRLASQFDPESTVFITAGRKAAQFVARTRRQLAAEFAYGDTPTFAEARAIAAFAARPVPQGRGRRGADRRDAVRQHAHAGGHVPRVPAGGGDHRPADPRTSRRRCWPRMPRRRCSSPSAEAVLGYLLGHYLKSTSITCC